MITHCLLAASLLVGAVGCEKKDAPPTATERREAAQAQAEKRSAEVAKERADKAVDVAKERQELAENRLDEAKDRAADTKDKVNMDRKGPGDRWNDDWSKFAAATDRTTESDGYVIERNADGTFVAWRKVKQVAGDAFAELKDAALVTEIKAKLAADEDTRAHKIDVDADEHTVTLRGTVRSPHEAAEAVRLALSTPGTEKVISKLTWKKM